jgi:ABC-type Fe3+-siderophore transport system permease subunit
MDTQLFRIQPPKQAMLREATITSGIIATFIGAPFFFFPYVDEDRISFTASITSLVVIYIVALIYLSLCVGWFTDYYTTGKKTIFEVDRKNLTIHQDGESTPYRLRDLHIDQMRGISLKKKPEYKPVLRSFDIRSWRIVALFYNAGQFQLSNGDTAEICLTDARHVVHIPTKLEHVLLLSPTAPNGLLLALIRAADPADKPEV